MPRWRALRNVASLLRERLLAVSLELRLDDALHPGDGPAPLDPSLEYADLVAICEDLRFEQILINLLGNALDAVAGVAAPRILVTIEASSGAIVITVADNGPGVPPELLPHLFEPFFTTKEMGRGLGLGLAISSSIASDAGGSLLERNAPEGGALFVLTLRSARTHHPQSFATGR